MLTDYQSDDAQNPYTAPVANPFGLTGDPLLRTQVAYIWTTTAPQSIADLDPLLVEATQRRDRHTLQQELGLHHRLDLQVDSAVALAELGLELYLYLPAQGVNGHYTVVRIQQPLSVAAATWTCAYTSAGV